MTRRVKAEKKHEEEEEEEGLPCATGIKANSGTRWLFFREKEEEEEEEE